jgi:hypothetical protein
MTDKRANSDTTYMKQRSIESTTAENLKKWRPMRVETVKHISVLHQVEMLIHTDLNIGL